MDPYPYPPSNLLPKATTKCILSHRLTIGLCVCLFLVVSLCLVLFLSNQSQFYRLVPDSAYCKCENLNLNTAASFRMVNGSSPEELKRGLPWVSFLFYEVQTETESRLIQVSCTATVISRNFVLTAMTCVHYNFTFYVGAGLDHDVQRIIESPDNYRLVKEIYPYMMTKEEFLSTPLNNLTSTPDLALLQMDKPWIFNDETNIYPACLMNFKMSFQEYYDNDFLAAGYGQTFQERIFLPIGDFTSPPYTGSPNDEMIFQVSPKSENSNSSPTTQSKAKLMITIFKATSVETNLLGMASRRTSACFGDSGGALMFYHSSHNILYVVAVAALVTRQSELYNSTHFVKYFCYPGRDGMYYAIVPNYMDWIQKTLNNSLCTAQDTALARSGGHGYSKVEYQSNYYLQTSEVVLIFFLLAIGLLGIGALLYYFVPFSSLQKTIAKSTGKRSDQKMVTSEFSLREKSTSKRSKRKSQSELSLRGSIIKE